MRRDVIWAAAITVAVLTLSYISCIISLKNSLKKSEGVLYNSNLELFYLHQKVDILLQDTITKEDSIKLKAIEDSLLLKVYTSKYYY